MNHTFQINAWETVPCPICSESNASFYENFGADHEYTLMLCHTCKNVYQNPRPKYDMEFVSVAYENYAEGRWHHEKSDYYDRQALQFDKLIDEILLYDKKHTAVLDVGCGVGIFLYSARKKYPKIVGMEISESNALVAEKILEIPISRDFFEAFNPGMKFSCINISHVIEHIPNPNEWIEKAKSLLEEDGVIIIEVPNWMGIAQRIKWTLKKLGLRKGKWPKSKVPEHLYEPTIPGMKYLFDKHNLELINYYTYSRKDLISNRFHARLFHRILKAGSNTRFYLKVKK